MVSLYLHLLLAMLHLIMTTIPAIMLILIKEKILAPKELTLIPFVYKTELEETQPLQSQVLLVKIEGKISDVHQHQQDQGKKLEIQYYQHLFLLEHASKHNLPFSSNQLDHPNPKGLDQHPSQQLNNKVQM